MLPRENGTWSFDLWTSNRMVLAEAGVRGGQMLGGQYATGEASAFFSARARRPCGRF